MLGVQSKVTGKEIEAHVKNVVDVFRKQTAATERTPCSRTSPSALLA